MNWKYEAIDKMKQYRSKKEALKNIPLEISRLELVASAIKSATADGTPVQGGGSGREDRLLNNIVQRQELEHSLELVKAWMKPVEAALAALSEEERLILERFYLNPSKGNVDRLCQELGMEQATVYRHREKALHRFTLCLYGCMES